jgi:catechol 2,3-dioxygenase-like lactoylglutathione lyase family enzyme
MQGHFSQFRRKGRLGTVREKVMTSTEVQMSEATKPAPTTKFALKLEVVLIPVSDVDRAKEFYGRLGWRLDADFTTGDFRIVQFTPPGSACSIQFGKNITTAQPGSAQGLYLVVSDIQAACEELVAHGVDASNVFHCATGFACRFRNEDRVDGREPEGGTYRSFATFQDPDGNSWLLQEITARLPGRVSGDTTYASEEDLTQALKRASTAHGQHEARIKHADANWPEWYATYMVREQSGQELPE